MITVQIFIEQKKIVGNVKSFNIKNSSNNFWLFFWYLTLNMRKKRAKKMYKPSTCWGQVATVIMELFSGSLFNYTHKKKRKITDDMQ